MVALSVTNFYVRIIPSFRKGRPLLEQSLASAPQSGYNLKRFPDITRP